MTDTVLVVGASGLVGTAACLEFKQAGWRVIAASRRVPELLEGSGIEHVPLDLQDGAACAAVVGERLADVTHVVYTAVYEMPGLVDGWLDPQQIDTNDRMLRNLLEPLRKQAKLRHLTLLQGTKAYGLTVGPIRVPARESQPRVEHPNFYWRQEDYLRAVAAEDGLAFTIFRPQLIVGPNHGVVMNIPPVIGVYAAIRRELGLPFAFPGGPTWVWEAVDVRLVGGAIRWAAESPVANGETYNLTNGEVFSFRDMWPALAATLGVDTGPDEPLLLAEYIPANRAAWERVVERHDLRRIPLEALLGESHFYADMCFAAGMDQPPPPTFVSSIKIRQAGYPATWNTEASFCYWLQDLMARRILPPAG
ncbi:MAG: NAD-dependent epimerase/dehydratase family protein [Gammaproteobacteria bacterium]|nr:NAD-dependent epimerase/dehydratase family protein [Gammaproteobacteria bacterium]MCP5199675.1 NAD-dependent epimerase/dehydratase family protein [Gammaproteobacteria bacterium]